jgi:hypothetical protein
VNKIGPAALRYVRAGFALVPLEGKRPIGKGWYLRDRLVTTEEKARAGFGGEAPPNIGVHLAASGIAELDVDDEPLTRKVLTAAGLDLDRLAASGWAIRGRGLRIMFSAGKLALPFHRLTIPDPTPESPRGRRVVFELRATADNIQSVLPPSIHPDTGKPYAALRPFPGKLPPVPGDLATFWAGFPEALPGMLDLLGVKAKDREPTNTRGLAFPSPCRALFNAEFTVEEILERNGFEQHGTRWRHPDDAGNDGCAPVPKCEELWKCFDLSNPLAAGSGLFDPWTAYVILEHGGNRHAAEAALPGGMAQRAYDTVFSRITPRERAEMEKRREARKERETDGWVDAFASAMVTAGAVLDVKPPEYIVRPLLPADSVTLLVAARNSGKTALAIGLALAVATGRGVGGLKTVKGRDGLAFYVAAEDATGVQRRFRAQAEALGVKSRRALDALGLYIIGGMSANLGNDEAAAGLVTLLRREAEARERAVRLVVFDTGTRNLAGGVDEDKASDVAAVFRSLAAIGAEFPGVAILVLVHPGHKDQTRMRGSSAWESNADCVAFLVATKTEATATMTPEERAGRDVMSEPMPHGAMREVTWTKMRNDALPAMHLVRFARFEANWLNLRDEDGALLTEGSALVLDDVSAVKAGPFRPVAEAEQRRGPAAQTDDRALLKLIAEVPKGTPESEMARLSGTTRATFRRARDRMKKLGLVSARGTLTLVTPKGRELLK